MCTSLVPALYALTSHDDYSYTPSPAIGHLTPGTTQRRPPERASSMKQSKDPFEVAFEEEDEEYDSPTDSPVVAPDNVIGPQTETHRINLQTSTTSQSEPAALQLPVDVHNNTTTQDDYDDDDDYDNEIDTITPRPPTNTNTAKPLKSTAAAASLARKAKEDEEEEEEEENMDVELGNPSTSDPDKMSKMQAILSQFTEEQMSRYESFRRSGFQKSNMKRLLASITGSAKISIPMTIVVSGIAKLFVGELVEAVLI
ncbi:transcription initiation factor TFIID subunit 11 isoform X3 [Rhododendron vialii]|uniref:transcription initiation factor TFIID subunit 11 isoform X3 n=1 Tax=Rhododendron vialii TaxID=182163 RepID=UPI00265FC25B|nr:transcription initiation factor TFIID subunit 11 isoform X3 [Rhododendron vialii]